MTTKTYSNVNTEEVELTFDNNTYEGWINIEFDGDKVTLSLDAHESGMIGEEAINVLEVEDLTLGKQEMIGFLESSLAMLKQEV